MELIQYYTRHTDITAKRHYRCSLKAVIKIKNARKRFGHKKDEATVRTLKIF